MSVSVCLSVTEVNWRIIANLDFKFRSRFTAHCRRGEGSSQQHLALCWPLQGPLVFVVKATDRNSKGQYRNSICKFNAQKRTITFLSVSSLSCNLHDIQAADWQKCGNSFLWVEFAALHDIKASFWSCANKLNICCFKAVGFTTDTQTACSFD